MARSERLTLKDVKAVYRLIGECRDLGADPVAWRARLQEGARLLIGAASAIGTEVEGFFQQPQFRILRTVYTGFDAKCQKLHQRYIAEEGFLSFDNPLEQYVQVHGELTTRSHEQLISRRAWEQSVLFNEFFRPTGIDDRMLSGCRLPPVEAGRPRLYDSITFYRALGDAPFTRRDRRLIRLLHRELQPLIGRQLASSEEPSALRLAPRLRKVLYCLLEGDHEKQVAMRLGLSRQTVHQYVNAIYRHYCVHSRAELLARWIRVRPEWIEGSEYPGDHTEASRR